MIFKFRPGFERRIYKNYDRVIKAGHIYPVKKTIRISINDK